MGLERVRHNLVTKQLTINVNTSPCYIIILNPNPSQLVTVLMFRSEHFYNDSFIKGTVRGVSLELMNQPDISFPYN